MDRPAPSLFVESRDRRAGGGAPFGLRRRRLITIACSAWLPPPAPLPWQANLRPPHSGLTAWRRAKPLRSIGLPCSSYCVAPSSDVGGCHRRGIQHFLRQVACLEGRVLAGSQIRTALLSQRVPRRHCGARPRAVTTALCNAAGHSGARQTEHRANTVVVSRMVWLSIEAPDWHRGAQRVRRPPVGWRPKARIDK